MSGDFRLYTDAAGEWRWQLRDRNEKIIGASTEGYKRRQDCIKNVGRIAGDLLSAGAVLQRKKDRGQIEIPV